MKYKFLSPDLIPQIHQTFHEAFFDYDVDMSYMTEEVIWNRAIKNGIDFDLSVGAFDDNKMIGFTLVGVDFWQGHPSAFDIMTGITKPFRGKGIARGMFDFTLPKIKTKGVEYFVLEVLQQNGPAIKAYSKSGFEVVRTFNCYQADRAKIKLSGKLLPELTIGKISKAQLKNATGFMDWQPSWENSISSLQRIPDGLIILGTFIDGKLTGVLAFYPLIGWINLLAVKKPYRRKGIAGELLKTLLNEMDNPDDEIKVINVDSSDKVMDQFLLNAGFVPLTNQYEMRLDLK